MKRKNNKPEPTDEMRSHYDFDYSKSRPNRFANRPKLGRVHSIVLEPNVAEVFESSEQVMGCSGRSSPICRPDNTRKNP
jgi:hypothetical protein